jgi:hypothetical protein
MKLMQSIFVLVLCATLLSCNKKQPPPEPPPPEAKRFPLQEGYPVTLIKALEEQQTQLQEAASKTRSSVSPGGLRSIVSIARAWAPGAVIKVAFKGGSPQLRGLIADAVKSWTSAANIKFDFGDTTSPGTYNEWSTADSTYRADIRIAFDSQPEGGYWSCVGRDSVNKALRGPDVASMNLEEFDESLPSDWQAIVLHEFGHALGFEHEHQNPNSSCEQEYRWDNEPGYVTTKDTYGQFIPDTQGRKPGMYTVLGGAFNWWPREQVDFNMRRLPNTTDVEASSFDKDSIMKYHFDQRLYLNVAASAASGCYTPRSPVLSPQDRRAAAARYPFARWAVNEKLAERSRVSHRMRSIKELSANLREFFRSMVQERHSPKRGNR